MPERGKLLIPSVLELFCSLKGKKSYDKKATFSLYEDLGCKSGMAVDLQGKKKDTGQREGVPPSSSEDLAILLHEGQDNLTCTCFLPLYLKSSLLPLCTFFS